MYLKNTNIVNGLIFDRLNIGHEKRLMESKSPKPWDSDQKGSCDLAQSPFGLTKGSIDDEVFY